VLAVTTASFTTLTRSCCAITDPSTLTVTVTGGGVDIELGVEKPYRSVKPPRKAKGLVLTGVGAAAAGAGKLFVGVASAAAAAAATVAAVTAATLVS
jgi:hypothetical protein